MEKSRRRPLMYDFGLQGKIFSQRPLKVVPFFLSYLVPNKCVAFWVSLNYDETLYTSGVAWQTTGPVKYNSCEQQLRTFIPYCGPLIFRFTVLRTLAFI